MTTHNERQRLGYNAFTPDRGPNELNPYHGRPGFIAAMFSCDWLNGWNEALDEFQEEQAKGRCS